MASKEIAAGSVVRLKSGGGSLTVGEVDAADGASKATCYWIVADGTLCWAKIPVCALEVL